MTVSVINKVRYSQRRALSQHLRLTVSSYWCKLMWWWALFQFWFENSWKKSRCGVGGNYCLWNASKTGRVGCCTAITATLPIITAPIEVGKDSTSNQECESISMDIGKSDFAYRIVMLDSFGLVAKSWMQALYVVWWIDVTVTEPPKIPGNANTWRMPVTPACSGILPERVALHRMFRLLRLHQIKTSTARQIESTGWMFSTVAVAVSVAMICLCINLVEIPSPLGGR